MKTQNTEMNLAIDEIVEEFGIVPSRTNAEWIGTLESRLNAQRKDLAALLDWADENPRLLPECIQLRRKMQQTKARLADFRLLGERQN